MPSAHGIQMDDETFRTYIWTTDVVQDIYAIWVPKIRFVPRKTHYLTTRFPQSFPQAGREDPLTTYL